MSLWRSYLTNKEIMISKLIFHDLEKNIDRAVSPNLRDQMFTKKRPEGDPLSEKMTKHSFWTKRTPQYIVLSQKSSLLLFSYYFPFFFDNFLQTFFWGFSTIVDDQIYLRRIMKATNKNGVSTEKYFIYFLIFHYYNFHLGNQTP